jgi:hypothetical protein
VIAAARGSPRQLVLERLDGRQRLVDVVTAPVRTGPNPRIGVMLAPGPQADMPQVG